MVALEALADEHGLLLLFDSAQGVGSAVGGRPLGGFGELEVFSFHATKILSATEGGCVCTDDDDLAVRLRSLRSDDGGNTPVPGTALAAASFSEAQAAIGLMSLDDFETNRDRNARLLGCYRKALAHVPGINVVDPAGVDRSNYQYAVLEVDALEFGMTRDDLLGVLHAENVMARRYFYPGVHRSTPYKDERRHADLDLPVTDRLCARLVQLPLGSRVGAEDTERLGQLIEDAHRFAPHVAPSSAAARRALPARVGQAAPSRPLRSGLCPRSRF